MADEQRIVVGAVVRDVHLVERAGAGRRRDLRDELVAVGDVDVLFPGDLVDRVALGVLLGGQVDVDEVVGSRAGPRSRRSPRRRPP